MSLILRNTKGSALTHTELDDNFSYLDTKIDSVALIANDRSTTGTSSSGSTFMVIQYAMMTGGVTTQAPNVFIPFATNINDSSLDYVYKVDDSTLLIKAGVLYKLDSETTNVTDDDAAFAEMLQFNLYSDATGNNLIKSLSNGIDYSSYVTANNLIRTRSTMTYIKSDVDCYLKLKSDASTVSDSSGFSLGTQTTLTKYNTTPILTDATGSYTQGAQELPGYKSTETLTEKRWIDGKPIYRKVITYVPAAVNIGYTIDTVLTSTNCQIVNSNIVINDAGGQYDKNTSSNAAAYCGIANAGVYFSTTTPDGAGKTHYIWLEYTKTSDTAGSPVALVGGVQDSYVNKFVGCSVVSVGTQSITSATLTKITTLTNKEYDSNSAFDTTTQRYTVPVSGYYRIGGGVYTNQNTTGGELESVVYKNGSFYKVLGDVASGGVSRFSNGSFECYLTKGDYLELWANFSIVSPIISFATLQVSLIAPNYGGQNTLPNYSTTETLTSERWIDGKPIYKKVVALPTLVGDNVWRSYAVASGLNTERVLKTHLVSGDGVTYYPDMAAGTLWLRNWVISKNAIDGQFGTNIINNLNGGYIVYEYTKTTDTASSPVTTIGGGGTPKKYYARIKNSVATTINRTQGTVLIPLNTFVKGDAELSNGTTGFIAPQDDVYTIDFNFRSNNALNINITNVYAYIIINGVTDTDYMQCANSTGDRSITGSASFKLNKNDIVTFKLAVFASDTTSALQVPIGSFVANIRN